MKIAANTADSRRFSVFAVLMSLAVLAWHVHTRAPFGMDWQTAGFVVALVVLVRPFSSIAFMALGVSETVAILIALPWTNQNRMLHLFVFATIILTGLYVFARSGFRKMDAGEWMYQLQPLLRLLLVIVYGLAAWHKLNWDFFNPQYSCAVLEAGLIPLLPVTGTAIRWMLIGGTIGTEMLLPLLLSVRRTRNFAVCFGVLFHIVLAHTFYSFSVTMIALLFLFAPDGFLDAAIGFWRDHKRSITATVTTSGLIMLGVLGYMSMDKIGPLLTQVRQVPNFSEILRNLWGETGDRVCGGLTALFALPAGFLFWLGWHRPAAVQPSAHCYRPIPAPFWILPALLLFDGANPYLGLKTETSFAMFSNLRTEGGTTNHLIWRQPLSLARYQEDLVQILDSNNASLQAKARPDLLVTFFTLRQIISRLADQGVRNIYITYVRRGKTIRVEKAESDPDLSTRPPWIERKFLIFRDIRREGCFH